MPAEDDTAEVEGEDRAGPGATSVARQPKVFISYSRADTAFVEDLSEGITHAGYQVLIDQHAIAGGSAWRAELLQMILEADKVVAVLSPEFVVSDECRREIEEARARAKSIYPVVCRDVDFSSGLAGELGDIQAIPMNGGRAISGLTRLLDALDVDLDWIKLHTSYQEQAEQWHNAGRNDDSRLIRGAALDEARHWLQDRPPRAPEPTEIQLEFIRASEAAEEDRLHKDKLFEELVAERKAREIAQRRTVYGLVGAVVFAVFASGSAIYAYQQKLRAEEEQLIAKRAANEAQIQRDEAEQQRKLALEQRAEAIRQKELADARGNQLLTLTVDTPEGRAALQGNCREAVDVVSALSTGSDRQRFDELHKRFWQLYYGNMLLVEVAQRRTTSNSTSTIEAAMVQFGHQLKRSDKAAPLPRPKLCPLAAKVHQECTAFLKFSAPVPCQ